MIKWRRKSPSSNTHIFWNSFWFGGSKFWNIGWNINISSKTCVYEKFTFWSKFTISAPNFIILAEIDERMRISYFIYLGSYFYFCQWNQSDCPYLTMLHSSSRQSAQPGISCFSTICLDVMIARLRITLIPFLMRLCFQGVHDAKTVNVAFDVGHTIADNGDEVYLNFTYEISLKFAIK